jgi:hypothetical protein
MRFSRGLKRSTPAKVAHRLGAHLHPRIAAALAAGPRGSADLQPCQRLDQGQTSKCTFHSFAGAWWCAVNAGGTVPPFIPSPEFLASVTYSNLRRVATAPGADVPKLTDDGAELQDPASAAQEWGIAPIGSGSPCPTSDGRFSDCETTPPDNTSPELDPMQAQIGGDKLVDGEYAATIDNQADLVVAAALDAGVPVWEGGQVDAAYESFENVGPDFVAPPPKNDGTGGGHAQYISAYRTKAPGVLEFRYENSWGSAWGFNGAIWVSADFVRSRWSLWPMAVKAVS